MLAQSIDIYKAMLAQSIDIYKTIYNDQGALSCVLRQTFVDVRECGFSNASLCFSSYMEKQKKQKMETNSRMCTAMHNSRQTTSYLLFFSHCIAQYEK